MSADKCIRHQVPLAIVQLANGIPSESADCLGFSVESPAMAMEVKASQEWERPDVGSICLRVL